MKLILLSLLLIPGICLACTCEVITFDQQMKTASAVFSAKVSEIGPGLKGSMSIKFEVIQQWKGKPEKFVEVFTATNESECGYSFVAGKKYLIFATGNGELLVSLCSRTKLLEQAGEDLLKLQKQAETQKAAQPRDPFSEMQGDKPDLSKAQSEIPKALNISNAVIVGISKRGNEFVALIRALNNKVYFLKVGDKLHDGVVLKIDQNYVTFRQYKGYRSVLVKKELRPFPDS